MAGGVLMHSGVLTVCWRCASGVLAMCCAAGGALQRSTPAGGVAVTCAAPLAVCCVTAPRDAGPDEPPMLLLPAPAVPLSRYFSFPPSPLPHFLPPFLRLTQQGHRGAEHAHGAGRAHRDAEHVVAVDAVGARHEHLRHVVALPLVGVHLRTASPSPRRRHAHGTPAPPRLRRRTTPRPSPRRSSTGRLDRA